MEILKFNDLEYIRENKFSKKCVVLIHGYGADMENLYPLHSYMDKKKEWDFIFPNGLLKVSLGYGFSGRAWFPIDMVELDRAMREGRARDFSDKEPEGIQETLKVLREFILSLHKNYDEIILGGFSQGAMLTSLLLKELPFINKAIFLSGNLIAKHFLAFDYSHVKFFQSHGTEDTVLGLDGAKNLFNEFSKRKATGEFFTFRGGHEISYEVLEKLEKFIS